MATIANLMVTIGGNIKGLEKSLSDAQSRLKSTGQSMTAAGKTATMGLTLPIVGAAVAIGKASIDFESAFTDVIKTVDATESQIAELETGIRAMAKGLPSSAVAISSVASAAGQLGIQTENILGFTRVMTDLGETTNMSADEATTQLARLANVTGMAQTDFDRLGSTIVSLGNNLATTEGEITAMSLRLAGAGSTIGLTEAEILGFAGALSSVGIEAEAGGSAFSKLMVNIASEVATGGDKLATFARVAGLSASEFSTAFKDDAGSALITFIEGLGGIEASGGNVFGVLEDLGMTEVRLRDAMLRASGAGDLFRQSLELGNAAWAENTALANEANLRYGTTASQLSILWNRIVDVAITLGDVMVPALMSAMDAMAPLFTMIENGAQKFAELDSGTQLLILGAIGLIAAIGPLLIALGMMATAIAAISWPIILVVAGMAALIAIGVLLYKNWDELTNFLTEKWNFIKELGSSVFNSITEFISESIEATKNVIIDTWTTISTFFVETWSTISSFFTDTMESMHQSAIDVWTMVSDFFVQTWDSLSTKATEVWDSIRNVVIGIAGVITGLFIPTLVSMAVSAVTNAALVVASWLTMAAQAIATGIVFVTQTIPMIIASYASLALKSGIHAAKVVASWISMSAQAVLSATITTAQAIPGIISAFIRMAGASIVNAAKVVASWVMTAAGAVANTAIMIAQSAVMVAKWVWMGAQSLLQAARMAAAWLIAMGPVAWVTALIVGLVALIIANWDTVVEFTVKLWNSILDFFKKWGPLILAALTGPIGLMLYAIIKHWDQIKDVTVNVWNSILDFLKGLGSTFFNAGAGLINMMKDGIMNAASAVLDAVKNIASQIRDFLPFSPAKVGPLSDLHRLDFAGPIQDSIFKGMPDVQSSMSHLLEIPDTQIAGVSSQAVQGKNNNNGQQPIIYNTIYLGNEKIYEGFDDHLGGTVVTLGGT